MPHLSCAVPHTTEHDAPAPKSLYKLQGVCTTPPYSSQKLSTAAANQSIEPAPTHPLLHQSLTVRECVDLTTLLHMLHRVPLPAAFCGSPLANPRNTPAPYPMGHVQEGCASRQSAGTQHMPDGSTIPLTTNPPLHTTCSDCSSTMLTS